MTDCQDAMTGSARWSNAVDVTALSVAWARAAESAREDRLFDDPLAAAFVAGLEKRVAEVFGVGLTGPGGSKPGESADPVAEEIKRAWLDYVAIRTRFFDDVLLEAATTGCRQVVILAAGMDARAFRLAWPPQTGVYELDQPEVLAYKGQIIASEAVRPRAQRHTVAVDLSAEWVPTLRAAGFQPDRPTAWLAEGLLAYLDEATNEALMRSVYELSAPGSGLAVEVLNSAAIHSAGLRDVAQRLTSMGAGWRFSLDDPVEWLVPRGWRAQAMDAAVAASRYGRTLSPLPQHQCPDLWGAWLVTAVPEDRMGTSQRPGEFQQ